MKKFNIKLKQVLIISEYDYFSLLSQNFAVTVLALTLNSCIVSQESNILKSAFAIFFYLVLVLVITNLV